jgi:hypothetical protein
VNFHVFGLYFGRADAVNWPCFSQFTPAPG